MSIAENRLVDSKQDMSVILMDARMQENYIVITVSPRSA